MASRWYTRIQSKWKKTNQKAEAVEDIQQHANDMAVSCGDGDAFGSVIVGLENRPVVVSIPRASKRLNLLHLTTIDGEKEYLYGLDGFSTNPSSTAVKLDDASAPLVGPGVAPDIRDRKLPTMEQILEAKTEKEILEIEGKSPRLGSDFQSSPKALIWSPMMLSGDNNPEGKVTSAVKLLTAMAVKLRGLRHYETGAVDTGDQVFPDWTNHLQYLWIIAKGWHQTTRPSEPTKTPKHFDDAVYAAWEDVLRRGPPGNRNKGGTPAQSGPKTPGGPGGDKDSEDDTKGKGEDDDEKSTPDLEGDEGLGKKRRRQKKGTGTPGSSDSEEARRGRKGRRRSSSPKGRRALNYDTDSQDSSPRRKGSRSRSQGSRGSRRHYSDEDHRGRAEGGGRGRKRDPREKGGRRRVPPHSSPSPSDSSSSSDEADSDDSEERRRARRKKIRAAKRNLNRDEHDKLVRTAIWEVALNGRDQLRKDRGKDSLMKAWTESNKKLFRLLSARSFRERGVRKLNSFASRLTKTKGIHRACQLVHEEALENHWTGDILKGALANFLSQGFRASDITRSPGGFTVFMSAPLGVEPDVSKEQVAQRLRETFGDGKLSEELTKEYANTKFYLPQSVDEARQQLGMAVDLLDRLTGYKSIASEAYAYGADYLRRNTRRAIQATAGDSLFPTKFLYLLDCVFQNFCKELARYHKERHPLREARHDGLGSYVRRELESALSDFGRTGSTLSMQLPVILQPKKGAATKETPAPPKADKDPPKEKELEEPWHRNNPSRVAEWGLPGDKRYTDFFTKGSPNIQKLPKLRHHGHGRWVPLCLNYQLKGMCQKGRKCRMAHTPKSKMDQGEYEAVDKAFREIYAGS